MTVYKMHNLHRYKIISAYLRFTMLYKCVVHMSIEDSSKTTVYMYYVLFAVNGQNI